MVQDSDDLERYNVDWTGKYRGSSKVALRPSTREQVAQILSYCNAHRLPVTPQGGNTGLVGGAVPVDDEIVLSLERMNRIISHDALAGVLTVEAGVILETADNYLRERSFVMPLDLGAKGRYAISHLELGGVAHGRDHMLSRVELRFPTRGHMLLIHTATGAHLVA